MFEQHPVRRATVVGLLALSAATATVSAVDGWYFMHDSSATAAVATEVVSSAPAQGALSDALDRAVYRPDAQY